MKKYGVLIFVLGVVLVILPDFLPGETIVDMIVAIVGLAMMFAKEDHQKQIEDREQSTRVIDAPVSKQRISTVPRTTNKLNGRRKE